MARPTWLEDAATTLREEMLANAAAVAERLAPPVSSFDGEEVSRREAIAIARAESYADPTYLARDLERMAPLCIPLPDGRKLRAETGLRNFLAKWAVVRPDLVALLATLGPEGVVAPPQPVQPIAPAAAGNASNVAPVAPAPVIAPVAAAAPTAAPPPMPTAPAPMPAPQGGA